MAATIPLIGLGVAAIGTGVSVKSSIDAAGTSSKLLSKQSQDQQALVNQAAGQDAAQQKQTDDATALQQNRLTAVAKNSGAGSRPSTILTSPLAALSGTRGIGPSTIGNNSSGGQSLIGM